MLLHFDVERSWQTYRLANGLRIMCSLLAVFVSTVWKMGENCLVKWLLFLSLSFATYWVFSKLCNMKILFPFTKHRETLKTAMYKYCLPGKYMVSSDESILQLKIVFRCRFYKYWIISCRNNNGMTGLSIFIKI